jgi:hypothetical protein
MSGVRQTAIVVATKLRVHTTWAKTGEELLEEYEYATDALTLRKFRKPTVRGKNKRGEKGTILYWHDEAFDIKDQSIFSFHSLFS